MTLEIGQSCHCKESIDNRGWLPDTVSNCVVIPECPRTKVLHQLHTGNSEMTHMKDVARSYAYWLNIDADTVRRCEQCALASKAPGKYEQYTWSASCWRWIRIHIDFVGLMNKRCFLIVADTYSKRPEIFPITQASTTTTIAALHRRFLISVLQRLVSRTVVHNITRCNLKFSKSVVQIIFSVFCSTYNPMSSQDDSLTHPSAVLKSQAGKEAPYPF